MVLVANAIGIAVISLFAGQGYFSYYSLVTLLEAAALLFTGGFKVRTVLPVKALEPEIKRDWSLIVGGIVLLASSFASGYLIG